MDFPTGAFLVGRDLERNHAAAHVLAALEVRTKKATTALE